MLNVTRDRARLAVLFPAALMVAVACSTGTGPTVVPTGAAPTPAASPDGTPTDLPTAAPTPTPDIGPASPTPGPTAAPTEPSDLLGEIDHPTDPTAVVLRMFVGGGFVPLEFALTELPQFTLYGDNTVVFRPSATDTSFDPGAPRPALLKATMTPEQVDALLRFAFSQGGLLRAREDYSDSGMIDANNTTFTINAGGVEKEVFIVALSDDPMAADAEDRMKFQVLADLLDSFEEQVAEGNVETVEPYQPPAYRATLYESWEGQEGEWTPWPWEDLTMEDFPVAQGSGFATATITPEQAAKVAELPSGGVAGILVGAPDGTPMQLALRPLLPDEFVDDESSGPASPEPTASDGS